MTDVRILLIPTVALCMTAAAQLPPTAHAHSAPSVAMIDGSKNPELIPDSTAYRLFFVSVGDGTNPTEDEIARHRAHLSRLGLKDVDEQSLAQVLKTFKTQYGDLIANYNGLADTTFRQGQPPPNYLAFLASREALVQETRDKLKKVLTPESMSKLDMFIKSEKRTMKVQQAPAAANAQ